MTRLASLAVQYVAADITTDVDPTGNTITMAFTTAGAEPTDDHWQTAAWVGAATLLPDGTYRARARVLVGEGTDVGALTDGDWAHWSRISAGAETVVLRHGIVTVY